MFFIPLHQEIRNNTTMANVIAYFRTSTDEQQYGIEAQRTDVQAFAEAHGLTIVAEFVEHISGKNDARPELTKASELAHAMGASIIVAKVDRLTRHAWFGLQFIESNKVVFCDHPNMGTLEQAVYFGMAQQEREYISARTKAGLKVAKANGKQIGRAKGADMTEQRKASLELRQSKARNSEANKKAFAIVSLINGTMVERANYLNENGFTTAKGGKWFPTQVKRLFDMYK